MKTLITMAAIAVFGVAAAHAQAPSVSYPSKAIRLVVTGTPGQGTDVLSRLIAQRLSQRINQQIVVENKAGAGGNIGASFVAKSEPDGYTLLMATNATHAANQAMYAKMPFDPIKDLNPWR